MTTKAKARTRKSRKAPRTVLHVLLDMTGSMFRIKDVTLDALNEYLGGLKEGKEAEGFEVSVSVFNSAERVKPIREAEPVEEFAEVTTREYQPNAATPLYDAIGESIHAVARDAKKDPVLFVIQTDGLENDSREYKRKDILKLVETMTSQGWQFVFMGCELDAMAEGANIGIAAGNTISYDYSPGSTRRVFEAATASTTAYAASGSIPTNDWFDASSDKAEKKTD